MVGFPLGVFEGPVVHPYLSTEDLCISHHNLVPLQYPSPDKWGNGRNADTAWTHFM